MSLLKLLPCGGPGFCQIAVTNACNAHCRFCGFPQVSPARRVMANPGRLVRGLGSLQKAGVRYLVFTGGEPLLYPHLIPILARSRQLGLATLVCTNGALLTPGLIREFQTVGLDTLIISLDAESAARHDQHRGLPGLTDHIRDMVPMLREAGLKAVASVTLSRLIRDLDALVGFVAEMGFRSLTFSYPLTRLQSSYLGYARHASVDFTPEELDRLFEKLKALKRRSPVTILNPRLSLGDMQRQLRRRPARFPCLAGYKYFFVDWRLEVSPCHYLSMTLGPLEDIHRLAPGRNGCAACAIDCYRDPSVLQYPAVALADFLAAWRQGQWLKGLKTLLHPYNFLALSALAEARHWIVNGQ